MDISYLNGVTSPPFLREGPTNQGWSYKFAGKKAFSTWLRGVRYDPGGTELEDGTDDWIEDMLARVALDTEMGPAESWRLTCIVSY